MKSIRQDGFFTDESLEGIPLHYKQYTMAGITLGQSSVAGFEIFAFTPHTHTHTHAAGTGLPAWGFKKGLESFSFFKTL